MNDTEKITINLSAVDLGKVDLLVQEALYSNRTDFIKTAIRNQLERHSEEVGQAVTRHSFVVGVLIYDSKELLGYRARGEKLNISVVGLLRLQNDIDASLALDVIESIKVRGMLDMPGELKEALKDRIR